MIRPYERDIPRYPGEPRSEAMPTEETTVFNNPFVAKSSEFVAQYMSPTANSKKRSDTLRDVLQFCSEDEPRGTFLGIVSALVDDIRSRPEDEQNKQRLESYENLFERVRNTVPNSASKAPIVQMDDEFSKVEPSEMSDIDRLHGTMFEKARKELGLRPTIPSPFLWYIEAGEVDELEKDIKLQTGHPLGAGFKRNMQTLLTDKERVGLTSVMCAPDGDVLFPGIILSKNWPNIISDPDRILLQENINSLIMRSSTIYQMGSNMTFLQRLFGDYAYNIRDFLISFTEQVGTETTEMFSKKLGTRGQYLKEHEYSVDLSGKAVMGSSGDATKMQDDLIKASPSKILSGLLGRYNPATEATQLFAAWVDGMAQATPAYGNGLRGMKKQILEANRTFKNSDIPTLTKISNGDWIRASTRRVIR